jgi:hypothetical protein
MATLVLDRVWINLVPTGDAVSARSTGRAWSTEVSGEIRTYADGRRRSVTTEGVGVTAALTLALLTQAELETLESWMGSTVQIRDFRGQRAFGVFLAVTRVEVPNEKTMWHAQLEIRTVSVDEGV